MTMSWTVSCLHRNSDSQCKIYKPVLLGSDTLLWNGFESHYYSPWDGLGATIKRYATRVSLAKNVNNPIQNSESLFKAAEEKFKTIKLFHVSKQDMENITADRDIVSRIKASTTIRGTRDLHKFSSIPGDVNHLNVKKLSTSACDPQKKSIQRKK